MLSGRQINSINDPDQRGLACNYTEDVVSFPTTGIPMATQRFPNEYVRAATPQDTVSTKAMDTLVCANNVNQIQLDAPPGYSYYAWNDGTSGASRTVTQPGVYWVQSYDQCEFRTDTFVVDAHNVTPAVITVNGHTLSTTHSYIAYQWYREGERIDGATNASYTVFMNGKYTVKVTDINGCTDSSAVYEVTNVSVPELHQGGRMIHVYPNPARSMVHIAASVPVSVSVSSLDGKVLIRERMTESINVEMLSPGIYLLSVSDMHGRLLRVEKLVME